MSKILEPARQFFEACETGKGWDACSEFCTPDATFSSQTTALAEIASLEGYCEWMTGCLWPAPVAQTMCDKLKAFAPRYVF